MRRAFGHRRRVLLASAGAILVVSVGVAYAAIPHSSTGVINGCYEKKTGILRVIDAEAGKRCLSFETPISWNQKGEPGAAGAAGAAGGVGPAGPTGPTGPQGLRGPEGPKGDSGDDGAQGIQGIQGPQGDPGADGEDGADGTGLESYDQVDGLPCTRGSEQGTTDLTYDDEGYARVQCVVEPAPAPCADSTDNGTPDAAIFLGSIRGAEGSDVVQRTARLCGGSDWWHVSVRQPDFSLFDFPMTAEIQVQPTSGDPDLRVFCRNASSGDSFLAGVSTLPGQAMEFVRVMRVENAGTGGGYFELLIQVSGFAIPTDYTLSVRGNLTIAQGPNNCDLE